ncbi:hypothetical protein F444_15127 [Phytophthora nicotianae P1976]|nr:hypothetical protein F444_15127 [Phytophthora nicotianae P1976]
MKCADPDCTCADLTTTDPCIVCERGVHHICSNELYDSGKLSERFCSAACVYQWKTLTSPPSSAADSDIEPRESLGQPSQVSQLENIFSRFFIHSSPSSGLDVFGIPLGVDHYRQENCRHEVWDVAYRLATPFVKTRGRDKASFSHVCLLCAQELTCRPYASARAWENALHRWTNTSNAKAHMVAAHEDHQLGQAEASARLQAATRNIDEATDHASNPKRSLSPAENDRAVKRRGTLQKLWAPTQRDISVYIAHWLISSGLAYNTVASEGFKLLVQRLTGNLGATILVASTFRDLLTGVWFKYCNKTGDFFQRELKAAHGTFLNPHHDRWTTGNGKVGVLGTTASFIDKTWNHCEIALLLTVGNPSHAATDMQRVIRSRIRDLYDVDISAMTQFTVLDTTASARKTSKLFEDSIITNCTMHVLNLSLQYAIGMRENKETVDVYDPATNSWRDLINRVRALNNYFSTQQRCQRLEKTQAFYGLPKIGPTLDCDTRVAFTVKLLERSIVNYTAFQYHFQCREKGDGPSVFESLQHADWRLMAEIESIVGSIADLARIEVQRSDLVAFELIVLLKFEADRLYSNSFSMFDLNAPRDPMTTVDTFRRILISGEAFSGLARVCLARMKGQLKKRIGTATAETVLILLIDPRTKFSVESLIVPSSTPETEKHASDGETQQSQQSSEVVSAGSKLLVDAHREMFCSLHAHDLNVVETNAAMTSPNFDLVPYVEVICGAPIKAVAEGEALKMTLHEQADRVLEEWLQYTVDWVATAVQHAPEKRKKLFRTKSVLNVLTCPNTYCHK